MTNEQRAGLAAYIRRLADLMELRDWRFKLGDHPAAEDCGAHIEVVAGRRFATVTVPFAWPGFDPTEQRHYACHELLHAHLAPVEFAVQSLQTNLGDHVFGVFAELHKTAIEHAIDAIADALAPYLPLPTDGSTREGS